MKIPNGNIKKVFVLPTVIGLTLLNLVAVQRAELAGALLAVEPVSAAQDEECSDQQDIKELCAGDRWLMCECYSDSKWAHWRSIAYGEGVSCDEICSPFAPHGRPVRDMAGLDALVESFGAG